MESVSGIKTVLVVEDEPVINQVCFRVLTGEGFEVDIAGNGDIAQDMLGKRDYALCLIDIRTPVMNGKQRYQHMIEEHLDIAERVIFTTGDMISDDIQSFLELSGRPFLAKPFTPDELKAIVRKTLRQIEK